MVLRHRAEGGSRQFAEMASRPNNRFSLYAACFFLSGAAGLIYEVVWSRQLTLFVGVTSYAHTAVITAYMLGLGSGSVLIGRLGDRHRNPLRLFAALELLTGIYAAATPWLFSWLQDLYIAWAGSAGVVGLSSHLVRFVLALLVLLPPTFLMGGTLPVIVRGLTQRHADVASSAGRLYGINTFGAVLGTAVAGYLLMPALGLTNTVFVGVAINIVVAVMVGVASAGRVDVVEWSTSVAKHEGTAERLRGAKAALGLFMLCGVASLIYQVAWIRSLTLVMGSSVYSFTTTLAAFLSGIALGSFAYGYIGRETSVDKRLVHASAIATVTGFSAVLGLMAIGRLPEVFLWGFQKAWGFDFMALHVAMFGISFAVMLVPTLLMGAMFPAVAALWAQRDGSVSRDIGIVYGANTAGCVTGALAGGLFLLPMLGVHGAVMLAGGINVLAGAGYGLMAKPGAQPLRRVLSLVLPVAAFGAVLLLIPAWDRAIMTSGVFNYAMTEPGRTARETLLDRKRANRILYYKDGRDGTVTVTEDDIQRKLVINGKIDATSRHDLRTQVMIGQLPLLMHPHPRRVLVVGLGSGITAGSVTRLSEVESIDIVELSPEVVAAAGYFSEENYDVLKDPRVHLVIADARNYLLSAGATYDVIMSEPSNPWITGVANLFTREFFEVLRRRLAPGGVLCQWFHIYNMSTDDAKSVLHSYSDVFPHVSAWQTMDSDLLLIGTEVAHEIDARRFAYLMRNPDVREEYVRADKAGLDKIAAMYLFSGSSLNSFCHAAPMNSDDRPRIEFNAPYNLYLNTAGETLSAIFAHLDTHPADNLIEHVGLVVGNQIVLEAIGLSINSSRPPEPGQWNAGHEVWRQRISVGDGRPDAVGIGSQIRASWNDAGTENRLKAFFLDEQMDVAALSRYLVADAGATPRVGGEVDLPGGRHGAWLLTDGDASNVVIHITWIAPARYGGFYQYSASRTIEDPGQSGWGPALLDFARSFTPLDD